MSLFGLTKGVSSLKVASCPSQDLARTNCVFVSKSDFDSLASSSSSSSYIIIENLFVYTCRPETSVPTGSIGLNSIQRKELRVALDDMVSTPKYTKVDEYSGGVTAPAITFEVDFVSKKVAAPLEIDADELSARSLNVLKGFIMSEGQSFVLDFYGTSLLLKVATIAVEVKGPKRALYGPETLSYFVKSPKSEIRIKASATRPKEIFKADFNFEKMGIGGLDKEFSDIFRRAFASRVFPPAVIAKLGISHVKGMLLYGPPGTGKTLIARQIGKMLNGKEPKVVNGPEILNKYVGQSEENIRNLFKDAEEEYAERGDSSDLHIIIFDEIDAICKQRGSSRDGTGVGDTVVNQLLSKIDGVNALNNILVIGMTNRKDMIDEALLRPGRLEVHVEISLPDEEGRQQILRIKTANMKKNGMLDESVNLSDIASRTKNYSGAEIEGLCKSAAAFALNRNVNLDDLKKKVDDKNIRVTMNDFEKALVEVQPAFGMGTDDLHKALLGGFIVHGPRMRHLLESGQLFRKEVQESSRNPLMTILVEGPAGTGKTALAAKLAVESSFPFVRMISPEQYIGYSEASKVMAIAKAFDDAHKSPLSVLVLDNLERLIEYGSIGPRYSNIILQALLVLIKQVPPRGRRLLILGTTSSIQIIESLELRSSFHAVLSTPTLNINELAAIVDGTAEYSLVSLQAGEVASLEMSKMKPYRFANNEDREKALRALAQRNMGIKTLLMVLEMVRDENNPKSPTDLDRLVEVLTDIN